MSAVKNLFSPPKPPSPPPVIMPKDTVAKGKASYKKKIRRGASGRQTILTSPLGATGTAEVKTKSLLGG